MLVSLLEVCQEGESRMGVKRGGTWRTLKVSDHRLRGHRQSCFHGRSYFTPRKISLSEVCQEWGVKKGVLGGH